MIHAFVVLLLFLSGCCATLEYASTHEEEDETIGDTDEQNTRRDAKTISGDLQRSCK